MTESALGEPGLDAGPGSPPRASERGGGPGTVPAGGGEHRGRSGKGAGAFDWGGSGSSAAGPAGVR